MSFREWTGWRVAAAWVLWLVLSFGGVLAAVIIYARAYELPRRVQTDRSAGPTIGAGGSISLDGDLVPRSQRALRDPRPGRAAIGRSPYTGLRYDAGVQALSA